MGTLPNQAPVTELTDERTDRPYLLYVPSTYSDAVSWPLVVACHGTWPWDTPAPQMREWARFAEAHGIIIITPCLRGVRGDFPPPPQKQIALQQQDEQAILAIVSATKRKYNIAEEQVFMTGWSAGAYAILHTGLRHPDIFRALAIRQGTFDEQFMDIPAGRRDPWQRMLVIYGMADFLRSQSKDMMKWLRDGGYTVDEREIAGSHRRIDPELPWRYFQKIAKTMPWLRIRAAAADSDEPRNVRFHLDAVPRVARQKWFFGDGTESYEASPEHTFDKPGTYEVTVNIAFDNGKKYARKRTIKVGWK